MSRASVYLDYNATAPIRPEAREALLRALEAPANPSSVHAAGRAARDVVDKAAGFTRIVVGATEHDAVVETAKASGLPVETWPVDAHGVAHLPWLEAGLKAPGRALVCLMLANNETGVIQPVAEAAALVRAADGWLHVDAVQAAGKIAIDFSALGADTMALSALASMVELGLWRDALAERVKAEGAVVLGEGADRLPQTLCFAGEGFGSEIQVMNLDLAGVMASAGSACSSGKVKASRVVEAMGRPDLAPYALRVSGGWASTQDDWIKCGDAWIAAWKRIDARRREMA
ncbi:MAG: aminotransferase [Caulobacter sp. 32-67-35]|nr:MAG: aminotransferase [Caulobacter sp. 32-67-35]